MPVKKTSQGTTTASRGRKPAQPKATATDRDLMETLLNTTKGACDLYLHGTIESATNNVHTTMSGVLDESLSMQSEIYSMMAQKGWYPASKAEQKMVNQTKSQYKNG